MSSGPSLAGLGRSASGPEKGFSGFSPRFEIEEPKGGLGRALVFIVLLGGLGVGAWMYYHPAGHGAESTKPQPVAADKTANSENTAAQQTPSAQEAQPVPSSPPAAEAAKVAPEPPADLTAKQSEGEMETPKPPKAPAKSKHRVATASAAKRAAKAGKNSPLHKVSAKPPAVVKSALAADTGESEFRKGEAYLYGRGVRENCDEAIKNLKGASAKGNAKARSTFGTMYATGHCVPRDLPTSYSWFALALRADPSNQILEKDLSAIWNQMTPPERQLATKKQ